MTGDFREARATIQGLLENEENTTGERVIMDHKVSNLFFYIEQHLNDLKQTLFNKEREEASTKEKSTPVESTPVELIGHCPYCNIEFKIWAKDHPTGEVDEKVCAGCGNSYQYQFSATVQSWRIYGK